MADFIDCGASDEDVIEVAKNTGFDVMKAALMKKDGLIGSILMNKGQSGTWKNKFSEELS